VAKKSKAAGGAAAKVNKSAMIREYLDSHKDAKPKEIVAALKEKGVDVSPNMVSIVKAKAKVKRAKRQAKEAKASHDSSAVAKAAGAAGLDAALTLYKAAQGHDTNAAKIRAAFLTLVEQLG
jgi:transposase